LREQKYYCQKIPHTAATRKFPATLLSYRSLQKCFLKRILDFRRVSQDFVGIFLVRV